jgi:hypothetical protein
MHLAGSKPNVTPRINRASNTVIHVGQHVRFVSGVLAGLAGVVVRREKGQTYVVGIPDADSRVLVRVERQRFR